MSDTKLWIATARTQYGSEYGLIAVIAATREEAIKKAHQELLSGRDSSSYVPYQDYADALRVNLDNIIEIPGGVFIDWDAARPVRGTVR
jgi:hypothetical protein